MSCKHCGCECETCIDVSCKCSCHQTKKENINNGN